MNKIISLIIILIFVATGSVQAGNSSFRLTGPDCGPAMPMDCYGDVATQPSQSSGQTDCCGAGSIKTVRASARPDRTFSSETLSDCENSFCDLPVQPPAGIIDSPRHFSTGLLLQAQQFPLEIPSAQYPSGPQCPAERTGPPVPLYTRYCVLRY
jgi:hypothetical protein